MKFRSLVGSIAALGLILGGVAVAPAAQASKGCVTQAEFAKAKPGMTQKRIKKLFGTNGKVSAKSSSFGITITMRDYRACTQFGAVSLLFQNGRLETKSAVF